MVCFPGAEGDNPDEWALEVKQVYDPLGIPRENVWGLEYNPRTYEKLRDADFGIQLTEDLLSEKED